MELTEAEYQAVRLSLLVSITAVVASLPFGIAVAWVLARKSFWGKSLVETLINLPLVLPPVVTGYLLLVTFGTQGWIGGALFEWFGIRIVFDWKGAALAAAIVSFPLMVRAIRVAFAAQDPRLEQAARSLGAGPWDAFFTVSLPLAFHGIVAGGVLSLARSMGEFGATIMIAGSIPGQTRTMPLEIYQQLESPGGLEAAQRIVVISIILSALALLGASILDRRGQMLLGRRRGGL